MISYCFTATLRSWRAFSVSISFPIPKKVILFEFSAFITFSAQEIKLSALRSMCGMKLLFRAFWISSLGFSIKDGVLYFPERFLKEKQGLYCTGRNEKMFFQRAIFRKWRWVAHSMFRPRAPWFPNAGMFEAHLG